MALLDIAGLRSFYGSVEALKGVDITVEEGEIAALIGANGAGKSTLLMSICGRPRAAEGRIRFADEDVTHLPTHAIMRRGIAHAPEGRRIFPRMTVLENLQIGATVCDDGDFARDLERVFALFPRLAERRRQRAGTLSGGERQMLALGRALMSDPKLLMLDEPSLGLAPAIVETLYEKLVELHREGLTLLLAEQSVPLALEIADYAYVLQTGRTVLEGPARALEHDPQVQRIYLGIASETAPS
jgi:branched-chain amino acid transport system ATP-binding protein